MELALPDDAEGYGLAHGYTYELSKTLVRVTGRSSPNPEKAIFRLVMKKADTFGPRSWYKAVPTAVFVYGQHKIQRGEVNAIIEAARADVRAQMAEQSKKCGRTPAAWHSSIRREVV